MSDIVCGVCRKKINFFERICILCGEFPLTFIASNSQEDEIPRDLMEIRDAYYGNLEDPDVVPEWNAIWHSHLVGIEVGLGRLEEAKKHSQEFLRLAKKVDANGTSVIHAMTMMAQLCLHEERFDDAEKLFKESLDLSVDNGYEEGIEGNLCFLKNLYTNYSE